MTPEPTAQGADENSAGFLAQAQRSLWAQRSAMDDALNRFDAAAPPVSQLAQDTAALVGPGRRTVAHKTLYLQGWRLAYLMATHVGDHIAAIGDAASTESPRIFAHMTLARAALEGSARINYLLCPSGTWRDRVLRAAALLVASADEEIKAVADFPNTRPALQAAAVTAAQRRRGGVAKLIDRADIAVQRRRRDEQISGLRWPEPSGEVVPLQPAMTRLVKALFPTKPAAYRVGSGAVHAQPWVLDDDDAFDPATRRFKWTFDPAAFGGSVDLAIAASVVTLETFAAMLGQDVTPEKFAATRREQSVSKLVWPHLKNQDGTNP